MRALTVKLAGAWSPEEVISRVGEWLKPNLEALKTSQIFCSSVYISQRRKHCSPLAHSSCFDSLKHTEILHLRQES